MRYWGDKRVVCWVWYCVHTRRRCMDDQWSRNDEKTSPFPYCSWKRRTTLFWNKLHLLCSHIILPQSSLISLPSFTPTHATTYLSRLHWNIIVIMPPLPLLFFAILSTNRSSSILLYCRMSSYQTNGTPKCGIQNVFWKGTRTHI